MLNRPATKIELNIEEEMIEFEEMKNVRVQKPIEFERSLQIYEILKLLPNYQKEMSINTNNINDKNFNVNEFNPHEFNLSDGKNTVEEFNLNNESSPKEFNLGEASLQDKTPKTNKTKDKILPNMQFFSTPNSNN